jgi:hypothetical protein
MIEAESSGTSLPLWAQLPATAFLAILLLLALRLASGASARFVVFACWLRFILSAYHVYTHREVAAGLTVNALGSVGLFTLGLLLLPRRLLLSSYMIAAYGVAATILISAAANGAFAAAFEPLVKMGLFAVIALHCYNALRSGDERRFGTAVLLSFTPLPVFQAISLVLDLPKSSELEAVPSYIGGYDHEAAFSVGLVAMFVTAGIARQVALPWRMLALPVAIVGILLANYRTAALAMAPLLLFLLLMGFGAFFSRKFRPVVTTALAASLVFVTAGSVLALDRFEELRTIALSDTAVFRPPNELTYEEGDLLNGRIMVWSQYYYQWKDGDQLQRLVGFGPSSWEAYFPVYAHNTFVGTLFEYGIIGIIALGFLIGAGLVLAFRTGADKARLVAAHLSFITLNMATMPMWLVEGLLLYGLLWGYTIFYRTQAARPRAQPMGVPVRPYAVPA